MSETDREEALTQLVAESEAMSHEKPSLVLLLNLSAKDSFGELFPDLP